MQLKEMDNLAIPTDNIPVSIHPQPLLTSSYCELTFLWWEFCSVEKGGLNFLLNNYMQYIMIHLADNIVNWRFCFVFQIDPSGDYKSIVTFKRFEPIFKLAGGINLPKIVTCVGSDGRGRRQLVKVWWLKFCSLNLMVQLLITKEIEAYSSTP